jgi:hypothetical protein
MAGNFHVDLYRRPRIFRDEVLNWSNDAIQFPRLIAEMMAAGFFADEELVAELLASMDLNRESLDHVVDRAQAVWDDVKARTNR